MFSHRILSLPSEIMMRGKKNVKIFKDDIHSFLFSEIDPSLSETAQTEEEEKTLIMDQEYERFDNYLSITKYLAVIKGKRRKTFSFT